MVTLTLTKCASIMWLSLMFHGCTVVKWLDSLHDARLFANSILNHLLKHVIIPACWQKIPCQHNILDEDVAVLIIVDPVYPLIPYLMTELCWWWDNYVSRTILWGGARKWIIRHSIVVCMGRGLYKNVIPWLPFWVMTFRDW